MINIKNKFPKPEDLVLDRCYTFTYNPEQQYVGDVERLKKVVRHFRNKMNFSCLSYKVYLELSGNGRIHFHGYIKIKEIKEFYLFAVGTMCAHASTEIDIINDDEIWYDYITKQFHIWQIYLYKDYSLELKTINIQTEIDAYYPIQ